MAKYIFLPLFLMIFISGCGESVFEAVSNKNTYAAQEDTLDYNFIAGNCSSVISHFDNIDSTAALLNNRETFMFLSSLLECGGFNIINGIGAFTENTSDIYLAAGAMVGLKSVDINKLSYMNTHYVKASKICQNKLTLNNQQDKNIAALCGFTGMIGTTLSLSELIAQISGSSNIELSEQGYYNALSGTNISENLDLFLEQNPEYIDNLSVVLDSVSSIPQSVEEIVGNTSIVVEEYKQLLYDENTKKVSKDKLKLFLQQMQTDTAG